MKLGFPLSLVLLMCIVFACSKDQSSEPIEEQKEEPNLDSITYFTFISERPKDENIVEEWIVLHDAEGKLLDFSLFDFGDNLVFESKHDISDLISVTEIRFTQYDYGKNYTITTTTGIEKGSKWTLGPGPQSDDFYQSNGVEGDFNVTVSGIPGLEKLTVTNTKFNLGLSYSSTTFPGSPPSTDISADLTLYTGENEYYVSILDGLTQLKYYNFSYENMDVSLNYEDFLEFDAYHSVQLPDNNFYIFNVAGFKEDYPYSEQNGVVLHDVISFQYPEIPTRPFVYGYLDIFEKYRTLLVVNYKNLNYTRVQYGPRLEEIIIPDPTLTITDFSRSSFRFNVDLDYISSSHLWSYSEGTSSDNNLYQTYWYVEAASGFEPFVGELPEDILARYPEMNIADLEYEQSLLNLPLESTEYNSRNLIVIKNE